jgi:hypothetical protein
MKIWGSANLHDNCEWQISLMEIFEFSSLVKILNLDKALQVKRFYFVGKSQLFLALI